MRRDERGRNTKWIVWLVSGAALLALLFVCGVGALILRSEFSEEIGVLIGSEPAPTLIPPPSVGNDDTAANELDQEGLQATAQAVQATNAANRPDDVTVTPEPDGESTIAPTATLEEVAPTAAVTPAPTVTIPPDGSVTALRVSQPFVIDGHLDGWDNIPSVPAAFRVYTINDWDGTEDSDGFYRLAYDDSNLYIGAVVIDDRHVQNSTANELFRGDSLEIQFDTDRDGDLDDRLSPDDFQVALSPGNFSTISPSAWRYRAAGSGAMLDAPDHSIQVAANQTGQGYVLEAAIPWADLTVRPTPNQLLGIALNVNDNDTVGSQRQEVMKSHISTRQFGNPSSWGILILSE